MNAPSGAAIAQSDLARPGSVFIEAPQHAFPAQHAGQAVQLDWHLFAVDVPAAWQALEAGGHDALAGVCVGHIDTGYTQHPALGFWTPGGTWIDAPSGINFLFTHPPSSGPFLSPDPGPLLSVVPEYPGPRDNLTGTNAGHGTRTSSILSGLWVPTDPPVPWPFFGAAPGVRVIPFRITNSVIIDHVQAQLAAAINAAVAAGCQVISISLGAIRPDRTVADAIDNAYLNGVIVCAAAGNVISEVIYPGRFNRTITVGGVTTTDGQALLPWSGGSHGIYVDVSGPADRIRRRRNSTPIT